MAIYVQGLSALAYYRNGGSATDAERTPSRVRSLKDATSSRTEIVSAGIWRLGIGEPTEERPLEVLLHDASQRTRSRAVRARVWTSSLPSTAFRTLRKDMYVSSPEFVFLQLANRLDLPDLIALGMELCGTYRRNVEVPRLGGEAVTLSTAYHQPPLSSPQRLRGFVSSMKSAPGQPKALKALDYVLPNSASPMETALYLLLCLPRRMGGYALPKPELNPPIVFSKSGRKYTLRFAAKPDLYWRKARLDLEYDSNEFHDESTRAIESMRQKALERMGIEVIGLTPDELFSTNLFHATAMRIARRLKRRIRSEREGNFSNARFALRQTLLFDDATAPPHFESEGSDAQATEAVTRLEIVATESDNEPIWLDEIPEVELWTDESQGADSAWDVGLAGWDDEELPALGAECLQAG